jgi:hypothetical protein
MEKSDFARFLHLCASKMRMEPLLFAGDRFAVTPQNGRFQREKV